MDHQEAARFDYFYYQMGNLRESSLLASGKGNKVLK
jgi:hypothetical protein